MFLRLIFCSENITTNDRLRERKKERERQTDRETETETYRETEAERKKEKAKHFCFIIIDIFSIQVKIKLYKKPFRWHKIVQFRICCQNYIYDMILNLIVLKEVINN
jgi:hypothetical protein